MAKTMDVIREIFGLLFGQDPELRQIIGVTLRMSTLSALVSALVGIPLGVIVGSTEFKA